MLLNYRTIVFRGEMLYPPPYQNMFVSVVSPNWPFSQIKLRKQGGNAPQILYIRSANLMKWILTVSCISRQ